MPDMENGRIKTRKPQHYQLRSVHELMKDGRWNEDLIRTIFNEEDCRKIKKISISEHGAMDRLVWVYSSYGQYTVKSGYALPKDMQKRKERPKQQRSSSSRNMEKSGAWKFLWSLNVKHKLKHFIWKCLYRVLPVNEVVKCRVRKGNDICFMLW